MFYWECFQFIRFFESDVEKAIDCVPNILDQMRLELEKIDREQVLVEKGHFKQLLTKKSTTFGSPEEVMRTSLEWYFMQSKDKKSSMSNLCEILSEME